MTYESERTSFDKWYKAKNGKTFDQTKLKPGTSYAEYFLALSQGMREYISDIHETYRQRLIELESQPKTIYTDVYGESA